MDTKDATPEGVASSEGLGLEPERAAFEAWFSESGAYPKAVERVGEFYKLSVAAAAWRAWSVCWPAAVAAERERWQRQCAGKRHQGCNYVATCGSVCNKCGQLA